MHLVTSPSVTPPAFDTAGLDTSSTRDCAIGVTSAADCGSATLTDSVSVTTSTDSAADCGSDTSSTDRDSDSTLAFFLVACVEQPSRRRVDGVEATR